MFTTAPSSRLSSNRGENTEANNRSIVERLTRQRETSTPSRRRLSDPSASAETSSSLRPLAVRSVDGSRWLPTPDEQSHRRGSVDRQQSTSESTDTPSLSQHACSAVICAVAKVFETTELLESILCFLDTKDVLSLRRTNKHWNLTVHSSPYLRLHFFTYSQWERPSSKYQLLPLNLPGITIEEDEQIHLGRWIRVTITPEAAKRICPEPKQRVRARSIFEGLRGGLGRSSNSHDTWPASTATPATSGSLQYESLHISQPPLLGMQAYLTHGNNTPSSSRTATSAAAALIDGSQLPRGEPPAIAKLSCDSGITLGFLAETAQELLGSQTSGPSDAGDVKVVFKAIISFYEADASPRRSTRRNLRTVTRIG